MLDEEEPASALDTSLLQSLAFIAGYCVHSVFKSTLYSKRGSRTYSACLDINEELSRVCSQCLNSLIEEDTFDLDVTDPIYGLIFSNNRGGLKCPSVPILEAVVKLWKVYSRIEMDSSLQFISNRSISTDLSFLNIKSHREG